MESTSSHARTAEKATAYPRRPRESPGAPTVTSGCRGSLRPATGTSPTLPKSPQFQCLSTCGRPGVDRAAW